MTSSKRDTTRMGRRDFLARSVAVAGTAGLASAGHTAARSPAQPDQASAATIQPTPPSRRGGKHSGVYAGEQLDRVAFPLGGIGAGMICLEGSGGFSHVSLRHKPEIFNEPMMFAALCVRQHPRNIARVLQGPLPGWKLFGGPDTGNGSPGKTYGLPRFDEAVFETRFPFADIRMREDKIPLDVTVTGWSPFEPGDPDNASLPVAGLEYTFVNNGRSAVEAVFSFNARNFMAATPAGDAPGAAETAAQSIKPIAGGFILRQDAPEDRSWEAGSFCARVVEPDAKVNHAWFRGGWYDALTVAWKEIAAGKCVSRPPVSEGKPSPGASLFVPFVVGPGEKRTIVVQLSWYVGDSGIRYGEAVDSKTKNESYTGLPSYRPWYSAHFADIVAVSNYWRDNYDDLRTASRRFSNCLYATSLPPEILEAVVTNLAVIKSPTVMRQADGRLWAWEGCKDDAGCCYGSCTHVWNYAQSIPHLFPSLERTFRETEFDVAQNDAGHQAFRTPLPIRTPVHDFHAACDGQLGGIIKVYREWRIGGDTAWMRRLWPDVRRALDYAIDEWDPRHKGVIEEPHHNTYDIEFWGPDGMCTSFYLAALQAAVLMAEEIGGTEPALVAERLPVWRELLAKGKAFADRELFNGEYYHQKVQWIGLRAGDPTTVKTFATAHSTEALELLQKEGPRYQYGTGCLSDGVLGEWLAAVCGVPGVLDAKKVRSHLEAVHKYNLRHDLSEHANPQRPSYAAGHEGGLLLCSWPRGGEPTLPFIYSNEVWIGIEYQAAAHMIMLGLVEEGLDIVRTCLDRYDGRIRNPFNQYECGHFYARAMSSYSLLQAAGGVRYDAVEKVLYIAPAVKGDFKCFFATADGYGLAGVQDGEPFAKIGHGDVRVLNIRYTPAA